LCFGGVEPCPCLILSLLLNKLLVPLDLLSDGADAVGVAVEVKQIAQMLDVARSSLIAVMV
jgi:hypothetical protein